MISKPCEKFKEGNVYLVGPKSFEVNMKCSNLELLDTPVEKLLLKDNFVDTLRVHGEPENFDRALKEFHRVLKKEGTLCLIVPYFRINNDDDLHLTLGEFVEKVEHEQSKESKSKFDYINIEPLLRRYFLKVKSYRLAHLVIFAAKEKI
jgi:ubiquinone/menaquinone biosynthesis C-methylase UbiE